MARYFFAFRSIEGLEPDEEGMELPHLGAVEKEVFLSLSDMAKNSIGQGTPFGAVEVTDASGQSVFKVTMTMEVTRFES